MSESGYQPPNWPRQMDGRFVIREPTLAQTIANGRIGSTSAIVSIAGEAGAAPGRWPGLRLSRLATAEPNAMPGGRS
jgi:hypothetical protein